MPANTTPPSSVNRRRRRHFRRHDEAVPLAVSPPPRDAVQISRDLFPELFSINLLSAYLTISSIMLLYNFPTSIYSKLYTADSPNKPKTKAVSLFVIGK